MCGIAGIVSNNRNIDKVIKKITSQLVHRGPDFQDIYINNELALAHTRLSIIDLNDRANQPMSDVSGKYTIVFNGEIYNFLELKKEMQNQEIIFKTNCDTEVILNGYKFFGINFFKKLRGFYSFCIFSHKENSLILARDKLGKKPLYYYDSNNEFIFASELQPLIDAIDRKQKINFDDISHYLWKGYYAHGASAFKNIKSVLPGEIIKFDIFSKTTTVIQLENFKLNINSNYSNRNIDQLKLSLVESIKYRFVSDVPVSMLLSGGVDSSLLTLFAGQELDKKFKTFYMGYTESNDEFKKISELISKKIKSEHNSLIMSEPSIDLAAEKMINLFGEPYTDYSALPSFELYKSVSKHSKVVIAGDGADEMFGGYKDTRLFLVFNFLNNLLPNINLNDGLEKIYWLFSFNTRLTNSLSYLLSPLLLKENQLGLITHNKGWNSFYRKKYMRNSGYKITGENDMETKEENIFFNSGDNLIERYMNYYLIRLVYDFLVKVDRTSMANSIEVRSPYLDLNMMEKINGNNIMSMCNFFQSKLELKKLLANKGFKDITKVKKAGFTPPINNWMKRNQGVRVLNEMTSDRNSIISELFDLNKVRELYVNKQTLDANTSRLWNLLILYKWSKKNY